MKRPPSADGTIQRCQLRLKSARAELHAGIVDDGGQLVDGAVLGETNLTVRRLPAANPPVAQMLRTVGRVQHRQLGSGRKDVVIQAPELGGAGDDAQHWSRRRSLEAAKATERGDLFHLEELVVVGIGRGTLDADENFLRHRAPHPDLQPPGTRDEKIAWRELRPLGVDETREPLD